VLPIIVVFLGRQEKHLAWGYMYGFIRYDMALPLEMGCKGCVAGVVKMA
jgi:hypothetical protein